MSLRRERGDGDAGDFSQALMAGQLCAKLYISRQTPHGLSFYRPIHSRTGRRGAFATPGLWRGNRWSPRPPLRRKRSRGPGFPSPPPLRFPPPALFSHHRTGAKCDRASEPHRPPPQIRDARRPSPFPHLGTRRGRQSVAATGDGRTTGRRRAKSRHAVRRRGGRRSRPPCLDHATQRPPCRCGGPLQRESRHASAPRRARQDIGEHFLRRLHTGSRKTRNVRSLSSSMAGQARPRPISTSAPSAPRLSR